MLPLHDMRIIFSFIIFSSLLFFSCESKETEIDIPPNIMSEDKLVKVLTDCYLGEGASGINVKNVTGQKFDSAYLFNPLNDNKISRELFDSSISFYTKHPKVLKIIYDRVLDRLSQMQASGMVYVNDTNSVK